MEKSSKGKKKPDSGAVFCRLCQYDGLFSWQRHTIFAHLLKPSSCGQHRTARHSTVLTVTLWDRHCNVTVSLRLADPHMHKSFSVDLGQKQRAGMGEFSAGVTKAMLQGSCGWPAKATVHKTPGWGGEECTAYGTLCNHEISTHILKQMLFLLITKVKLKILLSKIKA